MVPFIEGDEAIYRGRSTLPADFSKGILFLLVLSILLFIVSYYRDKRKLFPKPENAGAFDNLVIDFPTGTRNSFRSYETDVIVQLSNEFFGQSKGLNWQVQVDGKNIFPKGKKMFLYLPPPSEIPTDIKAVDLLYFFKGLYKISPEKTAGLISEIGKEKISRRFSQLEEKDQALVMLKIAGLINSPVYILKDFLSGVRVDLREKLSEIADGLKSEGRLLVEVINGEIHSLNPEVTCFIIYDDKAGKYIKKK